MASCAFHPEFEAKNRCTRCDRAICAACERTLNGKPYCAECESVLARKLAERRAAAELATSGAGASPLVPPPVPTSAAGMPDIYEPPAADAVAPPPIPGAATQVSNAPLGPPPGMLRPLAFALAAGLFGALAWYLSVRFTDYKLGLVAVGVGWLVGRGALFGAGGRGGAAIAVGSVAVALGAMLFGEYMIMNHFAHEAFAAEMPDVELPAYLGFPMFAAIYGETISVLDFVFYAIGAYEAWKQPASAPQA